jgi:hypothetical protein
MYRVKPAAVSWPPMYVPLVVLYKHELDREPLIPTSPVAVTIPSKTYT